MIQQLVKGYAERHDKFDSYFCITRMKISNGNPMQASSLLVVRARLLFD